MMTALKRRTVRALMITGVAIAFTGTSAPAQAEDGTADPQPAGWTYTESPQATAKNELAAAWVAAIGARTGGGATVQGSSKDLMSRYDLLAARYAAKYGQGAAAPYLASETQGGTRTLATTPYVATSLAMPSYQQTTYYYCGPTTGQDILTYKGLTTSWVNTAHPAAHSLSQGALAKTEYMSTDANRLTSVWGDRMNLGLNRWRSGTDGGFYVRLMLPSASDVSKFRNAFLTDLMKNEPFAVSTLEKKDTASTDYPTYNNHGNPSDADGRGHWIAARGYGSYYASNTATMTAQFGDPMQNGAAIASQFTTNLNDFYAKYVSGRGIVW